MKTCGWNTFRRQQIEVNDQVGPSAGLMYQRTRKLFGPATVRNLVIIRTEPARHLKSVCLVGHLAQKLRLCSTDFKFLAVSEEERPKNQNAH